nr:MAG TPA: hypothetical protein [Caudoviricetes sp.]
MIVTSPSVSHTLPTEAHDDPQASHSIDPFKSVPRSIVLLAVFLRSF